MLRSTSASTLVRSLSISGEPDGKVGCGNRETSCGTTESRSARSPAPTFPAGHRIADESTFPPPQMGPDDTDRTRGRPGLNLGSGQSFARRPALFGTLSNPAARSALAAVTTKFRVRHCEAVGRLPTSARRRMRNATQKIKRKNRLIPKTRQAVAAVLVSFVKLGPPVLATSEWNSILTRGISGSVRDFALPRAVNGRV